MNQNLEALLISIGCVVVVGALTLAGLFATTRRSVPWAIRLAPLVPVTSIAAGVAAASLTMLLEPQQVLVIGVVLAVATPVALILGAVAGARVAAMQAEAAEQIAARERDRVIEERRSELIAWLSHDIRTPLARMRALTEAFEDGLAPDDYSTRMMREVDGLSLIIEDIATMSRLQSPSSQMAVEAVDLNDLTSDVVAGNQPLAHRLNITLEGSGTRGAVVTGDPKELGRAINNLIVNALRHTRPEGFVRVTVQQSPHTAEIEVRDQCGGIPQEHLDRVFDAGWRGTSARTPGDAGAGLGLTISQRVVAAHGGSLRVANTGDGCTFVIALPLPAEQSRADHPVS